MFRSLSPLLFLLLGIAPIPATALSADALPELAVTLGAINQGAGLRLPSGGDGVNVAEDIDGSTARRMTGEGAQYLYVDVDHASYRGPLDLYVTVEAFADTYSRVSVEYDKAGPRSNIATQHMVGEGSLWLTGEGGWRRGVLFLPQARLGGGQNFSADFRLAARNVAIRKITVSPRPPAGYDFTRPVDLPSLDKIRVMRPAGIEWTLGNDASAEDAAVYKALSATGIESYVDWAGVESQKDEWDWNRWDRQAAILKAADLKWVPFLIAGPAYATPLWFQESSEAQTLRCLEHGENSGVQSIFNPALRPVVKRFLKAFAERYRDQEVLGSVLLGVTGIYGESLYPAGPEGGWTTRLTGDYHNHAGWWVGDPHAVTAFRNAMRRKYSSLAGLNAAWSTQHTNWDSVKPLLPAKTPSDQARSDIVEWYQDAMTDWSRFWAQSAREVLPQTPIYLVTGGSGTPQLGADFTAQAKAVAPFEVGIRITNEGNDYATNFTLTREVITATRHYGTYAGTEPAGNISPSGLVARVYNATSSGAREMHDYAANFTTNIQALEHLRAALPQLLPLRPRVQAALYVSRESWAVKRDDATQRLYDFARPLRDLADWDFVTRDTVKDGALRDIRVLVLCQSPVFEPAAAAAIEAWVTKGGILIASSDSDETLGSRIYDNSAWRTRLFAGAASGVGTSSVQSRIRDPENQHDNLRRIGRGYTIFVSGAKEKQLFSIIQSVLRDSSKLLPQMPVLISTDGLVDGKHHTITSIGSVRYDQHSATISLP